MRALDRKLIRDFFEMKGQILAICLVIACGIATFIMAFNTVRSLEQSQQDYYQTYRFAEVFGGLKRATRGVEDRIGQVPGVDRVQTRVVFEVNLDIEGLDEPAIGRLISIPDRGEPTLNALHIRRGRYLEPGRPSEVIASEAFAVAHGLIPGDGITAIINGSKERLTIVGIAISPEYIYQLRGGDILPDDKHFGVFWMGYEALATAFDMDGGFNDLALTLARGADERDVIPRVDLILERYGGLGAYSREEQLSHRLVSDEITGLKANGWITPSIFLAVAGFLLNVVLTRLINTQREEIAALKAFGYGNWDVGVHYLKLALSISIAGGVIGSLIGIRLGKEVTALFAEFYRFPTFEFVLSWKVVLAAFMVSCGCGGLSVA